MECIWKFGSKNVEFLTSRMFASSMIRVFPSLEHSAGHVRIPETICTKNEEETLTLKIIAAEKQDTDRKLTISSSTSNNSFHIQNAHPVILKGKKSVKIDIILYPKQIKSVQRIIRLICTPDGKDAKISEISIRLQKK